MIIINNNDILKAIHKETFNFFQNIFTSQKLQEEFDLITYANRDFVLNVIREFRDNPNACIVKPFYETNYLDSSVPRSIVIRRDNYGFIVYKYSNTNSEPSIIEPFRFVSIIKELIEDENIKREMYSEKETSYDNDISL